MCTALNFFTLIYQICPANNFASIHKTKSEYNIITGKLRLMAFRPRGTLARALYEKVHNDRYLDEYDLTLIASCFQWYKLTKSLPDKYQLKFVSFEAPDSLTLDWLEKAKILSANLWLQIWHIVAKLVLGIFMTQTDINGWLKRGSMFILSEVQFKDLLTVGGFKIDNSNGKVVDMLDIGAGDGEVTTRLARACIHMGTNVMLKVYATETSWTMRERLQQRQFTVIDNLRDINNVDLISCLNVLDRCADPHQIMADIYDILAPQGRVVIALVLPYSHYVETNSSHMPLNPLLPHWPNNTVRLSFEQEATIFFEQLEQMGFIVESWTKAPYLCEGDLRQSFYWLIDLVVVLSKNLNR